MKEKTKEIFKELFIRYPVLERTQNSVLQTFETINATYLGDGMLFCAGNGGSAADCEHIVGELLKSFKKRRKIDAVVEKELSAYGKDGKCVLSDLEGALPVISLASQTGIMTAFANDRSWDAAYAQQLYGLGRKGDCLIAISTSGNSKNCVYAALVAKVKGMATIALTGED